jgi:hypothetical protein
MAGEARGEGPLSLAPLDEWLGMLPSLDDGACSAIGDEAELAGCAQAIWPDSPGLEGAIAWAWTAWRSRPGAPPAGPSWPLRWQELEQVLRLVVDVDVLRRTVGEQPTLVAEPNPMPRRLTLGEFQKGVRAVRPLQLPPRTTLLPPPPPSPGSACCGASQR